MPRTLNSCPLSPEQRSRINAKRREAYARAKAEGRIESTAKPYEPNRVCPHCSKPFDDRGHITRKTCGDPDCRRLQKNMAQRDFQRKYREQRGVGYGTDHYPEKLNSYKRDLPHELVVCF